MNHILGILISGSLGFLCVNLLRTLGPVDPLLHLIAATAIGLALSAHVIFYTLFTVGEFNIAIIGLGHAALLASLVWANLRAFKNSDQALIPRMAINANLFIPVAITTVLLIPLIREASFFPFGGWDAWACWSLKAKFILLGEENWKNMFDPVMWRSNNQYPFLLPLINSWLWSFDASLPQSVPMTTTILWTILSSLILSHGLKRSQNFLPSLLAPLALFTIPFINTLSISQYSDVLVGFFLLGSLSLLVAAQKERNPALAALAGSFCGLISFTKSEGTIACAMIILLAIPYFLRSKNRALLTTFLITAAIAAIPAALYYLFWAPGNSSFINGFTSKTHPATIERLQITFMFLGAELLSGKWNGLWVLLTAGLLLSKGSCFKGGLWIVATFLGLYFLGAVVNYQMNTYFEIVWWLQTTLNRILYTILPTVVWWVFYALLKDSDLKEK